MSNLYQIDVKTTQGTTKSLKDYQGKVLLIVNTASGCGFTPQYEGLQKLYADYQSLGFEVLDFPCNQFGNQAPGTNVELADFCQLKYHTSFETFAKIDVNGNDQDPLFAYLKKNTPKKGLIAGVMPDFIKWNFTKFLVDRSGQVIARFEPTTEPSQIAAHIEKLLK